jgi:hypothetical protein
MKKSTTAGYSTAERKVFYNITDGLMNVNLDVPVRINKTDDRWGESSLKQNKRNCVLN